ncbi:sugar kinase [Roseibium polysiphoniae]|uniref:sugar kinase n=1 Tax=Roseibium polysiphoniae TaxID=2571221 RepID=UPI0032980B6C
MTNRFLSIGECMVEMAPTSDGTFAMGFAGDTLNTAWYARKLLPETWDVSYLTAVGDDALSDNMVHFLDSAGIDTSLIERRADRTVGLYMIQLSEGERSFAYWRSESAARCLAANAQALQAKLNRAGLIYFSGITLGILSVPDRHKFLDAIGKARANGSTITFDPNLRPRLWASEEDMCAAITEAARFSDIVLPSFEDEASHFGDGSCDETARRYAAEGAGLVIVKNGPGDVICLQDGTMTALPANAVGSIVDTTAAGDSFNAGFLAAYLKGESLALCVEAGNRLASAVIGQRGALVDVVEHV